MTLKLNISHKGKTWKLEIEPELLVGKSLGDSIDGNLLKQELVGYKLQITGGSDISGFPLSKNVEGLGLRRVLLRKGWGLHKKPKGIKKKRQKLKKGIRLRKTVRGKVISDKTVQINFVIIKEGPRSLEKIFVEQNNPKAKII